MKILSLRLEQFRKFDQPVLVDSFGDGLSLLTGPNETGKSTLMLALRAALFERHSTKSDSVKSFSPHHLTGARPTVMVEFEIAGERYHLEKSFLKRPAAKLETSTGRRFEGSEAENELKRLLGLNPSEKTPINKGSPAHFGVLLTPQAKSFEQPDLADGTRHSLEAAIADDIAELGSQSEVDGLLAEIDEMLFDFVSKRGGPKNRYKDVETRLKEIEHEIEITTGERDALRDQFAELDRAITERRELAATDGRENLSERLTSLELLRTQAMQRQVLENQYLAASQRLQAIEAKCTARQTRREERQRVADEITSIEAAVLQTRDRLDMVEETLTGHDGKLTDLVEKLGAASQKRHDLETLGRRFERLSQVEATLSALATDVRLELEDGALGRVTLDGEPAAAGNDLRQVTEGLSIDIEGIGRIGIEPKIEPMREALAAKAEIESEIGSLLQALDLDDTERDAIELVWQAVASEIEELERSRAEIEIVIAEERRHASEAKAALNASAERRTQLTRRLVEVGNADGEDLANQALLDAEIADAKAALDAAEAALRLAPQGQGPGAAPVDGEIATLRARIEERRRAMDEASKRVLALESAIAVRAGQGLDEKIDQLDRQRHLLTQERDMFALDHQALSLLQSTLRAAADEAKATFSAPLSARLAPYIQDLFPGATPVVTPDFSIRAIDRNGVEEPFLHLSDGTREQIAILARLAFADMLQDQGLPALIVLDDALAFSDSERLRSMVAILEKAAERMQVIILTCREDRFTEVEAARLSIEPAPEHASSAA